MNFSVTCRGKRFPAKITPMEPLQNILEQVIAKQKPVPASADCTLLVNGRPVELSTPLRFANIPSTAKLEVTTGQPSGLGVQQSNTAGPSSMEHTAAATVAPSNQSLRPLGDASALRGTEAQRNSLTEGSGAAAGEPSAAGNGLQPSQPSNSEPLKSSSREQNGQPAALAEVTVFTRADLEASSTGRSEEPPEEFYDFGLEDYAKVVQGYKAAKQRAEAGMRTAKMRADEEAERASRFPRTLIRVFLPDGFILQMEFRSLDSVAQVKRAVRSCLLSAVACSNWYLYTSPPKQVLKDDAATLYNAGLCPAARLHFGCPGEHKEFLKPEIQSLKAAVPGLQPAADQKEAASSDFGANGAVDADLTAASSAPKRSSAGAKPKWLRR